MVEVLRGVLEDLLERAGAAGRVNDAVGGDRQQAFLADAVLEVLGDVAGERGGGLIPESPCRHGQALAAVFDRQAQLVGHPEPPVKRLGRRHVDLAPVPDQLPARRQHGLRRQRQERGVERGVGRSGQKRAEVSRFHRAGPAAARHQEAMLREVTREARHVRVARVVPAHLVAAHDRDHAALLQEGDERLVHGVVVERFHQAGERVGGGGAAVQDEVAVDLEVPHPGVADGVRRVEAGEELLGRVEPAANGLKRQVRERHGRLLSLIPGCRRRAGESSAGRPDRRGARPSHATSGQDWH
ncbi:hypothetical protein D3C72_1064260 [compost metagenome]